jgi:tetratricopeptide (TPR) repeat protein
MAATAVLDLHRAAQAALSRGEFREAHANCIALLRIDPKFADAIFLLGMIALAHGQAGKALELIDRALAASHPNAEYLAQRARCLVLLKDDVAARAAAMQALALNPEAALTLDTLGVALTKAGDHDAAITAFELAVLKQPDNPQFCFNLAASQAFLGHFDQAESSYEQAITLQPDFYRAHWALSELKSASAENNHIRRLESLLQNAELDPDANLYLCHALAKEHEELKSYSRAFDYWRQGKLPKLKSLKFSVADYREIFTALHAVCTEEFIGGGAGGGGVGHESAEPIFVVGMPRSGTTLVERMLTTHGEVFSAGELNDFGLCVKRATGTSARQVLDAATVRAAAGIDFAALGRAYVESTRPRTGHTRHFIDKLPPNFLYAGFIRRALPQARIICLRRNPLDTCLSNFRQLFSINAAYYNYAYDLLDTGHYYLLFDALVRRWVELLGERFLVVQYENLVRDPESESRRIYEYCGLPWSDEALQFHRSPGAVATASAVQVRQPVYRSSVARWRHYEEQLQPLKTLLESHGIDCGEASAG